MTKRKAKQGGGMVVSRKKGGSAERILLRRRAEDYLRDNDDWASENLEGQVPEEVRQTLHELRVHQIELELQNEELRHAQGDLEESRARYFDLYDLAPAGYCTISEKGLILEANLTIANLLGAGRSKLAEQPLTRFILPEDQDIFYLQRKILFESGEPQECDLRLVRPDGTRFWAHLSAACARDREGAWTYRLVISDITDRKQAEEKLIQVNQQLQTINAEKDRLFSIISHDLKSPMCSLVCSTEMLTDKSNFFSDQEEIALLKELHKNAGNTLALLEDLLQWSRMSQNGIDYTPTSYNLDKLINMSLYSVKDAASIKDIKIHTNIESFLNVLVDQPMINTVVRNILFNAVKFTRRGGEIVITARQAEHNVMVEIQDNGIGMEEQVLPTLFTLDKEKRQLGTEGEKGTGLGLVLCKQFIEQHGGQIWVESEADKGTTVFFTLPGA